MKNEEILLKVIENVKKHGLDCELSVTGRVVKMFRGKDETSEMPTIHEFIFSHEFAKAFWGHDDWQCRLQQMVIKKNHIKYLAKFI